MLQYMINTQTADESKKNRQNKGKYTMIKTHIQIQKHTSPLRCMHTKGLICPFISPSVLTGLTDHEIISQVTMFLIAGYETSANTLVFLAYNLARNPEVMKRLQEEIDSTFPDKVY